MEAVVAKPALRELVERRRADRSAEGRRIAEAGVVDEHDQHVRRARRRAHGRRIHGCRAFERAIDHAGEGRIGTRQHVLGARRVRGETQPDEEDDGDHEGVRETFGRQHSRSGSTPWEGGTRKRCDTGWMPVAADTRGMRYSRRDGGIAWTRAGSGSESSAAAGSRTCSAWGIWSTRTRRSRRSATSTRRSLGAVRAEWGARSAYAEPRRASRATRHRRGRHRDAAPPARSPGDRGARGRQGSLAPEAADASRSPSATRSSRPLRGERGERLRVFENFMYYPPHREGEGADRRRARSATPLSVRVKTAAGPARRRLDGGAGVAGLAHGSATLRRRTHHLRPRLPLLQHGALLHARRDRARARLHPLDPKLGEDALYDGPALISWKYAGAMPRYGSWEVIASLAMRVRSKYYVSDDRIEIHGSDGILWVNRCTGQLLDEPPLVLYRDGETRAFHDLDDGLGRRPSASARMRLRRRAARRARRPPGRRSGAQHARVRARGGA